MTENTRTKLHLKLYLKYEGMANQYAGKIFNYERYSIEKEDIVQELRIKIYNCINTFLNKQEEYKRTGRYKPIPLEYYLMTTMNNRTKDFIKTFNKESVENVNKLSIQDNSYDEGIYTTMESNMDLSSCICEINGVDLFYKLEGKKRKIFSLFLKGFTVSKLKRMFPKFVEEEKINDNKNPLLFIQEQVEYLRNRKSELLDFNSTLLKHYTFSEE